ncbi:MAG: DUF4352 domain-containing protein [Candidatus Dojkabacteria bacterium]|nr:DUF4352 domain-containing protein [Candidatus Dojkabacteria bacterium]
MSKGNIAAESASSATKSFFGGITGTLGVVVGCVIVLALLCGGCIFFTVIVGDTNNANEPTKVGDSNSSSQQQGEKEFKIGDKVKLGDIQLEVKEFDANVISDNEYIQPSEGMKYVAVDVKVTYLGGGSESVDSYDFSLSDEEGYSYDYSWYDLKSPKLESKTLSKDMIVRGWLTFEVSKNSKKLTISYKPNMFLDDSIEVELW